jgi:hypothetical protein
MNSKFVKNRRKKLDFSSDEFIKIKKSDLVKNFSKVVEHLTSYLDEESSNIPISIFNNKYLTTFEALVKYLREENHLTYQKIADLLHRKKTTIATTYKRSTSKCSKNLILKHSKFSIPMTVFSNKLSILEAIVKHLKEGYHLSNHQVAVLLKRDDRTIWTVYSRAKKKHD